MFDSLDEQMKKDEDRISTPTGRMVRYAIYTLAAAAIFGGVVWGVHLFS